MGQKQQRTKGLRIALVSAAALTMATPAMAQDSWDYLERELYRQEGAASASGNASVGANAGGASVQTSATASTTAGTTTATQAGVAATEVEFLGAVVGSEALVAGAAGVGILAVVGGIAAASSDDDSSSTTPTGPGNTTTGTTTQ